MHHLGSPLDEPAAWRQAAMHAGAWALLGFGQWVVERKADGAFLGRAGLWEPIDWPATEVGWTLARAHWGHGYATEAARASVAWAWATLDLAELISLIAPGNAASQAVARRLGMTRVDTIILRGSPVDRWVLRRPA
jgi:RimJ/RimL family protein N-acetyltransferase